MEKNEKETIILFNKGDADDGYFTIATSIKSHYMRIIKRVGLNNLINLDIKKDSQNNDIYWNLKLPISYMSKATFGIKKPVKPEHIEARKLSLVNARTSKMNK